MSVRTYTERYLPLLEAEMKEAVEFVHQSPLPDPGEVWEHIYV